MKKFLLILGILLTLALFATAGWLVVETIGWDNLFPAATEPVPTTEATEPPTTEVTEPPTEETIPEETVPDPFTLNSHHSFVFDMGSSELLYARGDLLDRVYPASLTKLFTAYVALQHLDPYDRLTAGDELDLLDPDSSLAYIYKGQTVYVSTCIQGMLMKSGNDAAYILAVGAGRAIAENRYLPYEEALQVFMDEVNRTAEAVGLFDTHFTTPDGIHAEDHYTTMADLVTICGLALETDLIRKYCGMLSAEVTYVSGETAQWGNTNALLYEESEYYNPMACGLKTGSTDAAGACLVSAFSYGDSYLIIGTLGALESGQRYEDTNTLYYYFAE